MRRIVMIMLAILITVLYAPAQSIGPMLTGANAGLGGPPSNGHARLFNTGAGDYLQSASALTALTGVNQVTLSFDLYWNSYANDNLMALESSASFSLNAGAFVVDPESNLPGLIGLFAFGATISSNNYGTCGFVRPSAGAWHHYVLTIDMTSTTFACSAYVDSVPQSLTVIQPSSPAASSLSSQVLNVMSRNGTSLFGNGRISSIAIFSGIMASADVDALDACARPTSVTSATLLYYWPINQTSPEAATTGATALNVHGTTAVPSPCSFDSGGNLSSPTITGLTASTDANSAVLVWNTSYAASTSATCGTQKSVFDDTQTMVTSHTIPVGQLAPSTGYTCTVCSWGACSNVSVTTAAAPASTPITGVSLGASTNYNTGAANPMQGDAFWNAVSNDGYTYIESGDGDAWAGNYSCVYSSFLGKATSLSPITMANVNNFLLWPGCSIITGKGVSYPHMAGLFSLHGQLFSIFGLAQSCAAGPVCVWFDAYPSYSNDHGATWNSYTAAQVFAANPALNAPVTTQFWGTTAAPYFSDSNFVMQGADDGTMGYLTTNNRVNNANVYVYGLSNNLTSGTYAGQGVSAAGDSYYMWRVPRAKLANLNPADYEYYTGGDGTQAAAWSKTQGSGVAILTNDCNSANLPSYPGCLGNPSVNYIPSLNRYLLMTYYWNNGTGSPANTTWLAYESQYPWGPWTLIQTLNFTNGAYAPAILQADALSASFASTTMRLLWAQNWNTSNQNLYYGTLTVNH